MPDSERLELGPQHQLATAWKNACPTFDDSNIHVLPSIEHALRIVRSAEDSDGAQDIQVLVSGSLHLVGGLIEVADLKDVALASGPR